MSKTNTASTLSKFNFFAIVAIAAILFIYEREQSRLTDYLYNQIQSDPQANGHMIDFSAPEIQPINGDFMIVGATQEKHLTGVKFKGRIINATALKHTDVEFNLTANPLRGDRSTKQFTINQISSGNSTGFSVYIPEITLSEARHAKLEYYSSSMYYKIK